MSDLYEIAEKAKNRLKFDFPYDVHDWFDNRNLVVENYHKHTAYSNLTQPDSATLPEDQMRLSESRGRKLYFSGEHGFQGEWWYIYDLCQNSPLSFRYSVEAYWVKDKDAIRTEEYIDKKGATKTRETKDRTNCHMVIVARNYNAVRKMNYILSCAASEGFYFKPRIDLKLLFTLDPEDVYITSACVAGWLYEDAEDIWLSIWRHFGDSFFFEYQAHNTEKQKIINKRIYELSQKYGIQTIIGLDTHYLDEKDRIKRENILARKKISYPDEEGWYMDDPEGTDLFLRMYEQNVLPIEEILYAMMNTHVFVQGCEDFTLDTDFKIPIYPKYKDLSYDERARVLQRMLNDAYRKEPNKSKERIDGIKYEYGEIYESGTVDYFIDNAEIISLATSKEYGGHLTTTSRGSAASYYCSKLLGFTTMDRFEVDVPIYPQRFITKDRILTSHQMPDVDLNISNQEPFVKASRDIFGEHSCYPLLAVGTLGEKSGFKLYADIQGIEPSVANEISKNIDSYNEALKQAEDDAKDSILIEDYITDPEFLRIFNESKPYQGIPEQAKVHACGFCLFNGNPRQPDVIGYGDIRYEIGLMRCHSESTGKSVIVACVEGGLLDKYGMVKDDFLIVDVVSIITKLYASIGQSVPTTTELRKMVTGDELTWSMYAKGATCCLNQCEKASTTKKVMKYKPQSIRELSAFVAGIRPGFKSHIDGFLARKPYTSGEPAIDELLSDCFHYMIYQEAVMKIFSYLGIPMKDSYDTIKKISKKKLKGEALKHVEDTLKEHWLANVGNMDNFEPVYQVIKDSARYAFNAPHAYAVANDSLYEAWMKAHHTSKFYEVVLNHYDQKGDSKDKIAELEAEARNIFGYEILPYRYGNDNTRFIVDDENKTISPSLASVKGIGAKVVKDLYKLYQRGCNDFVDLYFSSSGSKVNNAVFEKLVKIGYFSAFGSVKKLMRTIEVIKSWKGQKWEGRKTLSKAAISDLGLDGVDISKYATDVLKSGNISDKQYSVTDWKGLVKEICKRIPDDEYSLAQLVRFQSEILGYIEYKDARLPGNYAAITDLDTKYSPKFRAYYLKNGKGCDFKIHKKKNIRDKAIKTSWADVPVSDGDIILIKGYRQEPRRRKNADGKWEQDPEVKDWWITEYQIVSTL